MRLGKLCCDRSLFSRTLVYHGGFYREIISKWPKNSETSCAFAARGPGGSWVRNESGGPRIQVSEIQKNVRPPR